jgi:hypothetical protein
MLVIMWLVVLRLISLIVYYSLAAKVIKIGLLISKLRIGKPFLHSTVNSMFLLSKFEY